MGSKTSGDVPPICITKKCHVSRLLDEKCTDNTEISPYITALHTYKIHSCMFHFFTFIFVSLYRVGYIAEVIKLKRNERDLCA